MKAEGDMNGNDASGEWKSKRIFLRLALLAVGGGFVTPPKSFASDDRLSKQAAEYQDGPKDIARCATCTLFVAPGFLQGGRGRGQRERLVQAKPSSN
jgi:hypothetical protein